MTAKRCTGTTKAGKPCQLKPKAGGNLCGLHASDRKVRKRRPRTSSFGAIRKLPSKQYQATYWKDGTRHSKTFPTVADAKAWLSVAHSEILHGQWSDPQAGKQTFSVFAEQWMADGVKGNIERRRIRPTTEAKYRGLLDRHIIPKFGLVPLADVKLPMVRRWNTDLKSKHPSTAASAYRLLATIFNAVVEDEILYRSPCRIKGASTEPKPLQDRPMAEKDELQAAIDVTPAKFRCALLLASWTSLRRSEVLALQRKDVDIEAGTVSIERSWLTTESGHSYIGPTKTEARKGVIHFPSKYLPALAEHLDERVGLEDDAWLFPGSDGLPVQIRTFSRVWARAREKIERPDLHFHDLKRSGLTWAAWAGATQAELERRGGHSGLIASKRYQAAADHRDRTIAEKMTEEDAS